MTKLFRKFFGGKPVTAVTANPQARPRLRYDVADDTVIYAIGDIHGCYEALLDAEKRIVEDTDAATGEKLIVLLGDYVDRGKRSSDVLQHLCSPPPSGFRRVTLCGNHDDAFLQFMDSPHTNLRWLEFGGVETLYSYGVDAEYLLEQEHGFTALRNAMKMAIPQEHIDLLQSLPVALSTGGTIFVHAGIRPGMSLELQSDQDLMWIREPFLSKGPMLPSLVVHGHTATEHPVFATGRIGIDTAAFATGNLTVLKLVGNEATVLAAALTA